MIVLWLPQHSANPLHSILATVPNHHGLQIRMVSFKTSFSKSADGSIYFDRLQEVPYSTHLPSPSSETPPAVELGMPAQEIGPKRVVLPVSLQFSDSSKSEPCEHVRIQRKPAMEDNIGLSHGDPESRKAFPIASKVTKSITPKMKTDERKDLVRKAVINFLGKHSEEEGQVALCQTADIFGNQRTLWDQMIRQLEHRGARGKCLQVFRFLMDRSRLHLSEYSYCTIIGILGRDGKLGVAKELFDGMKEKAGITPTVTTYNAMINGYAKQGLLTKALDVYDLMHSEGCNPNIFTFNILIHACIKDLKRVVQLYEKLRESRVKPDDITYNCMINACVNGNDLEKASTILQEMRKDNFHPNLVTYTSLMNAYGKAGRLKTAVKLFDEMKENGCAPNSWTYNILLKAYGNEGLYDEALVLYKEMECSGCIPTLYTFNTVIDLYGQEENFAEAENMLLEMQRMGLSPDRVTYNTLIYSYSKAGLLSKAGEVLERMVSQKCRPDLWTYNILLDATAKYGTYDETIQLYDDLRAAGHGPNVVTYGTLMTLYGKSGLYKVAEKTLEEMSKAGCLPNVTVYTGLINSFSQHGMYKEAQSTFEDMVKAGIPPDIRSYTVLMDAFGRAALCDEAESLFSKMVESGFVPDLVTYAVLLRAFANSKRWYEGMKYYRSVQRQSSSSSELYPKLMNEMEKEYEQFTTL